MSEKPIFPPNLAILISIVAVSTASILIRLAEAPAMALATWRLTLSVIILLPFFIKNNGIKKIIDMQSRELLTLIGVGFVLSIHFAAWITSLGYTSVASSVIFVHIDPIFVTIVSHFILKEKVSKRSTLGIIIALIGAGIIALGDINIGEQNLFGDLLSIVGALALGIYILAGRKLRQSLDLTTYVTPVYTVSALFLALGSVLSGTALTGYNEEQIFYFITIAVIPMIFGHTIYNWTLKWVTAPVVSISLLGEPIGASILAYFILNESVTFQTLFGGVITLLGIVICSSFEKGS
ncbi:DMT family transporter [Candidatus Bathyarchaeota archaeon]|nr:DMT family transporter [Candidatus Bathyarchaeota archaeon]